MTDIRQTIAAIVEEVKHTQLAPADSGKPLKELGIDSLDIANILLAVEERFELKISDSDAEKLGTVDAIVEYVEAHRAA